jgi:1,2-diacylglycerol 3-alpha-glucosyltransferase
MRIGLFADAYFPIISGVSLSVDILANELRKLGHEVYIICGEHENAIPDKYVIRVKGKRYPMKGMREYRYTAITNKLVNSIAKYDFDIVHCHTEFTMGRIGRRVAHKLNVPIAHTYHTMYEEYVHFVSATLAAPLRFLAKLYSRQFANSADDVIFPTIKVKRTFDRYGFKKSSHIIPTGIYLEKFDQSKVTEEEIETLRASYGIPKDAFVLQFLGRISREKSLDKLIDMFAKIKEDNVYLLIVGGGPDLELFANQCKELGIADRVKFTGMIKPNNVTLYYRASDLFVNFSTSETQGLTYLESLASDIPLLVKYDDNLENLLIEGQNGFSFSEDEDFIRLYHKIRQEKGLYEHLVKGTKKNLENYSAQNYAKQIEQIYINLLNK